MPSGEQVLQSRDNESHLLREHEALVQRIARDTASRYKLQRFLDDLLAYGRQGLLEAARRYQPDKGAQFSTFAYYRIRGAMLDGCRSMGLCERGARRQVLAQRLFDECQEQRIEQGDAQRGSEWMEEIDDMVSELGSIYLLTDCAELDNIPSEQSGPEQVLEQQQTMSLMHRALQELEQTDRRILEQSFFEGLGVEELARREGCSKGWASRLRKAALLELRKKLCQLE
jgi:RNA polymerase sigma factor for flagellar operon FliA